MWLYQTLLSVRRKTFYASAVDAEDFEVAAVAFAEGDDDVDEARQDAHESGLIADPMTGHQCGLSLNRDMDLVNH